VTTVRRYRPDDADAVRRLHERVLREAGTDPADVPDADDVENVQRAYLDSGGEFLVADDDSRVVGMGWLQVEDGEGELFRTRVAVDRQGEGIGTRLLHALEDAARERGVETLRATTASRQAQAVAFYPANGYERVGDSTYGDYTLVHFEKQL
jgi:ribosomal protein S18 acetylase RimI-like enzyme